jgi:hypothetical protein
MCCVLTILLFFGPRLAILIWWLINRVYINAGDPVDVPHLLARRHRRL